MEAPRGAAECFLLSPFSYSRGTNDSGNTELEWLHRGGDSRNGLDLQRHKVGTNAIMFEDTNLSVWPPCGGGGEVHEMNTGEEAKLGQALNVECYLLGKTQSTNGTLDIFISFPCSCTEESRSSLRLVANPSISPPSHPLHSRGNHCLE